MLGETIGNFKIVRKLGRGGMGEVWLAEQQSLGTPVAIKLLLEAFPPDSEDVLRFFNEARAVSRIQHAGITKIFDSGILPNGRAYLVMEYLDGESLAARLARGPLSRSALCDIGRQIASVLDATHTAGITHRDLKPENVFLIADHEQPRGERVKVLDFGVAKLTGTLAANSPRTFGTLGTPMYMAPEQWGDASQVDWRADLYSLGCVAFEMACRRPPFPCTSVAEACAKHLHDAPVAASSLAPGIPAELDRLIAQLLAKQPEARPRSMREVARAFEQLGRTIGLDGTSETMPVGALPPNADVLATVTAGEASGHAPVTLPRRRRLGLVVGGGAVVAGAAVAVTMFALRAHRGAATVPLPVAPAAPASGPVVTELADPAHADARTSGDLRAAIERAAAVDAGTGEDPRAEHAAGSALGSASGVAAVHRVTPVAPAPAPTIDRTAVLDAIRAHRTAFQRCNEHHDTSEQLRITFSIDTAGRASKLEATGGNDALRTCAGAVIRAIAFPHARHGSVEIAIPLAFAAQPDPVQIPAAELPERLSQDQIAKGLLAAEKGLDGCMSSNHVEERVVLALTIEPTGRVSATDAQGHLAGSPFAACAFGVMRGIQFPPARTRLNVTVPVTP